MPHISQQNVVYHRHHIDIDGMLAVSPLLNLEMQHDGRSAEIGWKEFNYFLTLW